MCTLLATIARPRSAAGAFTTDTIQGSVIRTQIGRTRTLAFARLDPDSSDPDNPSLRISRTNRLPMVFCSHIRTTPRRTSDRVNIYVDYKVVSSDHNDLLPNPYRRRKSPLRKSFDRLGICICVCSMYMSLER